MWCISTKWMWQHLTFSSASRRWASARADQNIALMPSFWKYRAQCRRCSLVSRSALFSRSMFTFWAETSFTYFSCKGQEKKRKAMRRGTIGFEIKYLQDPGSETEVGFWHQLFEPQHHWKINQSLTTIVIQQAGLKLHHTTIKKSIPVNGGNIYLLSITLHSCLQNSRFFSKGVRINFCSSSNLKQKVLTTDNSL